MTKWEYKTARVELWNEAYLDESLNEQGEKGWELIHMSEPSVTRGAGLSCTVYHCTFKRPVEAPESMIFGDGIVALGQRVPDEVPA